MECYSNGVAKPKYHKVEAKQLEKLFGNPTGYDIGTLIDVLMWNPHCKEEKVRAILIEKYGQPTKDRFDSGWSCWPTWTDWEVGRKPKIGRKTTIRILKTGPRSCRVGLLPCY